MTHHTYFRGKTSAAVLAAALGLGGLVAVPSIAHADTNQGHVVLIGGAIKPGDAPSETIIQEIVNLAQAHAGVGHTPRIAILTAASQPAPNAEEANDGDTYDNATANGLYYRAWFEAHGASAYPVPIDVNPTEDYPGDPYTAANAFDTTVANEIRNSDAVYFGGGDQTRYVRSLFSCTAPNQAAADMFAYTACTDTPAMAAIREVVESGGVTAGTSAGLTIQQGADMISGGDPYQSWRDPSVAGWFDEDSDNASTLAYIPAGGLGFFTEGQLDSHFARRDRQPRLVKLSLETHHERGFGVEEKTALVVDRGARTGKVIGALGATMLDVSGATFDGKSTSGVRYSYFMTGSTIDFANGAIMLTGPVHTGAGTAPEAEPDIWKSYECDSNPYIFGTLSLAQAFVKSSVSRASGDSCDSSAESPRFRTTFNRDDHTRWSDDGSFTDVAMSITEIPSFTASASVSGSGQPTAGDTADIAITVTNTGGTPLSGFSINGARTAATTVLPGATTILHASHTVTEGSQTFSAEVVAKAVDANGADLNVATEAQTVSLILVGTAKPAGPGTEKPGTEKPGTEKPGTEKPGTEKTGTEKPGTEKPGAPDQGKTAQDPAPAPQAKSLASTGSPSPAILLGLVAVLLAAAAGLFRRSRRAGSPARR